MNVLSWEDAISVFGNPLLDLNAEGNAAPEWEAANLVYATLPAPLPLSWAPASRVTRFKCHRLVRIPFERAFVRIYSRPEVWRTIDDFGGCYALRAQRGSKKPSTHCLAISIDLDVADNPMGQPGEVHPFTIESFEAEGFMWGGRFIHRRIDPMHFEFADLELISRG